MAEDAPRVRLRQAVLVAEQLEPVAALVGASLGLGEPFRDPGVGEFGLANAVFAIGDCFLEVISPLQAGTAAGRHLQRTGADGGYMVLFDLTDLDAARERAGRLGVRTVWQIDLPDISGTHLHPVDMPGAIVSLDASRPYGSWRWGGPQWTAHINAGAPGRLTGITVAVADPAAACERWAEVLGLACGEERTVLCEDAAVRFVAATEGEPGGIVEISVAVPAAVRAGRDRVEIGAAQLILSDL